jgi:hypothetical protein
MCETQAVELARQTRDRQVDHAKPHPPRLEPRVQSDDGRQDDDGRDEDRRRAQKIWSFSMTGFTETTCRLNLSSDSSSPAATPTSCDRWRIGIP